MNAYSRLKRLLTQQHLSVPELHRRIRALVREAEEVTLTNARLLAQQQQQLPVCNIASRISS
jgi:hypothetical protein